MTDIHTLYRHTNMRCYCKYINYIQKVFSLFEIIVYKFQSLELLTDFGQPDISDKKHTKFIYYSLY